MQEIKFDVIRGNISEIKTLAAGSGTTKGVDADVADAVTEDNLDEAVAFAKAFSEKSGRTYHKSLWRSGWQLYTL